MQIIYYLVWLQRIFLIFCSTTFANGFFCLNCCLWNTPFPYSAWLILKIMIIVWLIRIHTNHIWPSMITRNHKWPSLTTKNFLWKKIKFNVALSRIYPSTFYTMPSFWMSMEKGTTFCYSCPRYELLVSMRRHGCRM